MASHPRIAVIGAGLAGIAFARHLHDRGFQAVIFEKSRGWGGRCATRQWEGNTIDHGAQYFTLRDEAFRTTVQSACGSSLRIIEAPILSQSGEELPGDPRYYHEHGNNRLARDLSIGLRIYLECPIGPLHRGVDGWDVAGQSFDHVISTAPLPQSLNLAGLPASAPMVPCLTAVFRYTGHWPGITRSAYAFSDHSGHLLAWTACENHKVGRITPGHTVLIAQASASFSLTYMESDPSRWVSLLQEAVETRWHLSAETRDGSWTHRWRYARIGQPISLPAWPEGFVYTGDALTQSRVESAWLAGWQSAEKFLTEHKLKTHHRSGCHP
jgi:predicted NAD/FAD-dependent oxidoreductase